MLPLAIALAWVSPQAAHVASPRLPLLQGQLGFAPVGASRARRAAMSVDMDVADMDAAAMAMSKASNSKQC